MVASPLKEQVKENTSERQKKTIKSKDTETRGKRKKRYKKRKFPILLRSFVVLILIVVATILGAMFGYSILGDGAPADVLNKETWQHIIDIVKKTN